MTFTIVRSTGCEALAFQSPASGCALCGGAGAVPDPVDPVVLRPCPRCRPARRQRPARIDGRAVDRLVGEIAWYGLIWSFYATVALFGLMAVAALWRLVSG